MRSWETAVLGRVFNQVGQEFGVPPEHVSELFESYFRFVHECMQHHDMPTVCVPKLGSFYPAVRNIRASLARYDMDLAGFDSYKILNLDSVLKRVMDERKRCKRGKHGADSTEL